MKFTLKNIFKLSTSKRELDFDMHGYFGLYYNTQSYYIEEEKFLKLYNLWLAYFDFICTLLYNFLLGLNILSGPKNQTETDPKIYVWFGSRPKENYILGFFVGPAGLCLSPGPTRDPIRNILCILSIFGYFEYVYGITDIFVSFKFGFGIVVWVSGNISKNKIWYFRFNGSDFE